MVSDTLLESYADVKSYAKLKDNLYYLEVPTASIEDENKDKARYILCYNPVKAVQDKAFREAAMEKAEEALSELQQRLVKPKRGRRPDPKRTMVKVAEILTKKGVQAFFAIDFDGQNLSFRHEEAALVKEALRDGKFVVKTNTDLPAGEVVLSYKTRMNVERAFREIKNILEVGPLYHWNEKRVRGHIFVCVLAYLLEQELQVLYRRQWQKEAYKIQQISDEDERIKQQEELDSHWYAGERIVEELASWHVQKAEFLGKEFLSVPPPPPTPRTQQVLADIAIPLPQKIIHLLK